MVLTKISIPKQEVVLLSIFSLPKEVWKKNGWFVVSTQSTGEVILKDFENKSNVDQRWIAPNPSKHVSKTTTRENTWISPTLLDPSTYLLLCFLTHFLTYGRYKRLSSRSAPFPNTALLTSRISSSISAPKCSPKTSGAVALVALALLGSSGGGGFKAPARCVVGENSFQVRTLCSFEEEPANCWANMDFPWTWDMYTSILPPRKQLGLGFCLWFWCWWPTGPGKWRSVSAISILIHKQLGRINQVQENLLQCQGYAVYRKRTAVYKVAHDYLLFCPKT